MIQLGLNKDKSVDIFGTGRIPVVYGSVCVDGVIEAMHPNYRFDVTEESISVYIIKRGDLEELINDSEILSEDMQGRWHKRVEDRR